MKRILVSVLAIILLSIGIFLLVRYYNYKKDPDPDKTFIIPKVEVTVAEINNLTREKTELTAKVLVDNPMPLGLTVDSIGYKVYIENNEVIKSSYRESITLKGNDTSSVNLPITILNKKLFTTLKKLEDQKRDSVEYRINATFYANLLLKKEFNIEINKRLPLIHPMEIKVTRIEVKSLVPSDVNLLVHAAITNKNVFPIQTKDLTYQIAIEKHPAIKGEKPGLLSIPPKSTKEITLPIKTSFKNVSKAAFELITEGKNTSYQMEVTMRLQNKNDILKDSKIVLEGSGTLNQLTK